MKTLVNRPEYLEMLIQNKTAVFPTRILSI